MSKDKKDKPELRFGIPDDDIEARKLAHERAVSQAMLEQIVGGVSNFDPKMRQHPLAVGLNFLNAFNQKKKIKSANERELALAAEHAKASKAEMDALVQALTAQGQDPAGAILGGMTSRYPRVAGMAGDLWQDRGETYRTIIDKWAGKNVDPTSVFNSAGTHNFGGLRTVSPKPPQLQTLNGANGPIDMIGTQGGDAHVDWKPAAHKPVPAASIHMGQRPGWAVLEQQGKYASPGGEGYKEIQDLRDRLEANQNALWTLAQDPAMGAGADFLQVARKWAETLGMPVNETTSPTELAKMQLGQIVHKRLGGLGAQVSDADRKFMMEVQGTIGSDPSAVRRLMLLESKYLMQIMNRKNNETNYLRNHPTFKETGVVIPEYNFKFTIPEQYIPELDAIFAGNPFPKPLNPAVTPKLNPGQPPGNIRRR